MARCAGCAASAVNHTDTNCIHLTGDGSVATPLVATLEISPDAGNELVCRANGLFAPTGGGGGGGQVLYFTVGTPGVVAFAGTGATPPTLFATADFQGDGINDSVAIQAAIDAAVAVAASSSIYPVVLILPGIYLVNTPLQAKAMPIIGQEVTDTVFYTATFLGAPANTRTIDTTISGDPSTHIENIQINSLTGGAAIIKSSSLYAINCAFLGDGKGADAGLLDIGIIGNLSTGYGRFENNSVSGTSAPFPDPGLILRDPGGLRPISIRNNVFSTDFVITGINNDNAQIVANNFSDSNIILNATSQTRFNIQNNHLTNGSILATLAGGSSFYWTVLDNIIENGQINIDSLIISKFRGNTVQAILFGDAFVLSNCSESNVEGNQIDNAKNNGLILTSCHGSVVEGNRIRFYGSGTVSTDDGIQIITSDNCTVQCNSLEASTARYGINVISGNLNFVTNNRLNSSGTIASLNDTGAGTVTVAGNYL